MNLNEVKKHVKFDMFLTFLIYFFIAVCLFLALIFTLAIPAKADSMKVYCSSGDYSSCVALYQGSNSITANTNVVNNFNTSSSYRYFTITSMSLQKNVKYLFKITYKPSTKELKNVYFKEYSTDIDGNTSSTDGYLNFSIDTAWGTGGYQSTATFTYQPSDSYRRNTSNFINLDFGSSGVTITGIDITEVDSQTAISLDELKDQQNDLLSNKCSNMLNLSDYYHSENGATVQSISPNGISIYSSNTWAWLGYQIPTEVGKTYYVKGNMQSSLISQTAMLFVCSDIDCNNYLYTQETNGSFSNSFVATTTTTYFRLYASKGTAPMTGNYYDVMLSPENDPFCVYGTSTSKLDWISSGLSALGYTQDQIKDIQQQQKDYLMDDTDPTVPNNEINDVLGLVNVNNPLGYLISLPLTLVQKLNTALNTECVDYEIGKFGFTGWNETLKFPCIHPERHLGSSLWNTIDIIVGIGLLALTIYKVYQAVSNILTLGGEDTASGSFVYWSPMEFLAIICGGTSVGVYQRRSKE